MANRFNADNSPRGGSPNPVGSSGVGGPERGGFGSEQNPSMNAGQPNLTSQIQGNPHSSSGFKRALMKTARTGNSLKDQLPNKQAFAGKGFQKPNYFAQGGARHGMHIGAGAPAISPAQDTGGSSFGGE